MQTIKHKITGDVLCDGLCLEEVLELHKLWLEGEPSGVRANFTEANLAGVDFTEANFKYANFARANLTRANLTRAYLTEANLAGANFTEANFTEANFAGSNLAEADLTRANLTRANFIEANLAGADINYQIQEGLLKKIADIALKSPDSLCMGGWHECETAHCIAGWACHLNPVAKELEKTHGPEIAGLLTLGAEAHSYFFESNEEALEFLKGVK